MSYLDESLAPGETIVARFVLHWTAKWRLIVFLLLAIPTLGIALLAAIYEWIRLRSIEQGVTNRRVVRKTGIVSRVTEELRLASIETIDLNQSLGPVIISPTRRAGVGVFAGRGREREWMPIHDRAMTKACGHTGPALRVDPQGPPDGSAPLGKAAKPVRRDALPPDGSCGATRRVGEMMTGPTGRMFGFGNVVLTGRGESAMIFTRLAAPLDAKRAIESAYAAHVEDTRVRQPAASP